MLSSLCIDSLDWPNGQSSKNGENDYVSADRMASVTTSLVLIRTELIIEVLDEETVRGKFTLNSVSYNLKITDPIIQ